MRITLGYKFIFGFLAVVASVAFVPGLVEGTAVPEWLKLPITVLTAMLIGLILGSIFTRSFTKRFANLTKITKQISLGDLNFAGDYATKRGLFTDEVTDLEESLLVVVKNLRTLVTHLKDTIGKLADAQKSLDSIISKGHESSGEVVAGTGRIFDGALQQARCMEESSNAVSEVKNLANDVAEKVTDAANASQKVNSMVQRGANTSTGAIEKMENVFTGIEKTELAAERLREKLGDIPKILDVITHVSRQTDLLALNATIEASKAGEHGRGFALVAEEVRRLADNTNRSVDNVSRIVQDIFSEVEKVVSTANEGASNVKEGRDDLRKIRDIFSEITEYTASVVEKANNILSLTQRQKEMSEKTVLTIEEVANITRQNLSSTELMDKAVERHGTAIGDTLTASKNLSELAEELKTVASGFKAD